MNEQSYVVWEKREKVWRRDYRTFWCVPCHISDKDMLNMSAHSLEARLKEALQKHGIDVIIIGNISQGQAYVLVQEPKKTP